MRLLLLLILLLPAPVRALEICDELWFTRNLLFHRAGHCFDSVLGKAVFDNADCRQGEVEIDPSELELKQRVLQLEAEFDCKVDTGRDLLAVPQLTLRKALVDLPMPSEYESACVGWKGKRLPLHTARHEDSPVTGAARDGDTLLFQFEDVDGWAFVEIYQSDIPAGAGWARVEVSDSNCTAIAG